MANSTLNKAKKAKNDEFYTDLSDIEKEMIHYRDQFKGKHIFLNCDDPEDSHFWKYFELNFQFLGLKQLTATHFDSEKPTYRLDIHGDTNGDGIVDSLDIIKTPLKENGDFRSSESLEILCECDIVVTNPPFSLFKTFIDLIINSGKQFLVIGTNNTITLKEFFPHILSGSVWLGVNSNKTMDFRMPDHYEEWDKIVDGVKIGKVPGISWFTNMHHGKRKEELVLVQKYTPEAYPAYDNYDAINVDKVVDIPVDYKGAMGVPITYLTKHNPNQFDILGLDDHRCVYPDWRGRGPTINGKNKYRRLIIKAKGE